MTSGPLTTAPPPTRSGTRRPRAALLVIVLAVVSAIIYFPFFKVYEKQLLAQEAEEALKEAQAAGEQAA